MLDIVALIRYNSGTVNHCGRDYQAGQMRALIAGGGRARWRIDCPAVLGAEVAKRLANQAMARKWAERDRMTVKLPPSFLTLLPGDLVDIAGASGRWSVGAVTIDGLVVTAELKRTMVSAPAIAAEAGRAVQKADIAIGATDLALFDFPDPLLASSEQPTLLVVGSAEGGFRPVPVSISIGGQPFASVTLTRRAALGHAVNALPDASSGLLDLAGWVEIDLASTSQNLLNADDDALALGANLALLGEELIQFGRAQAVAPGRWRLSRLLRGRRGTEWASGGHVIGERVWLVDRAAMAVVRFDAGMRGASANAVAYGIADNRLVPPSATRAIGGEALRPLAPAHVGVVKSGGGALAVAWVPRSRDGFAWIDGAEDAPLDGRSFEVTLVGPGGNWTGTGAGTALGVSAAAAGSLGTGEISVSVAEIGPSGRSRSAETTIIIN